MRVAWKPEQRDVPLPSNNVSGLSALWDLVIGIVFVVSVCSWRGLIKSCHFISYLKVLNGFRWNLVCGSCVKQFKLQSEFHSGLYRLNINPTFYEVHIIFIHFQKGLSLYKVGLWISLTYVTSEIFFDMVNIYWCERQVISSLYSEGFWRWCITHRITVFFFYFSIVRYSRD
jgi:hypothetical protein